MKIIRDKFSGAIINLDEDGYKQAKVRKELQKRSQHDCHAREALENKVSEIEKKISDIAEAVNLIWQKMN